MQKKSHNSRDFGAGRAIQLLTNLSPVLVILTTLLSLLVIQIIDTVAKIDIFVPKMGLVGYAPAFLIPFCILIARLGFGLLGAKDIAQKSYASGIVGLLGTFAIALYEHNAVTQIATVWKLTDYAVLFQFIVWLAVAAELRLMMTLGSGKKTISHLDKLGNGATRKIQQQQTTSKTLTNSQPSKESFSLNATTT